MCGSATSSEEIYVLSGSDTVNNFQIAEIEQLLNAPNYDNDSLINPELYSMIYSLGRDVESEEEYQYALNVLLSLCDRKSQRVRAKAILAIGLLAVYHKRLERERIELIIKKGWAIANEESKATIQDAIDDINHSLNWNMTV